MARKRMIAPSFWEDEAIGACEPMARLLYLGMVAYSNNKGRVRADAQLLRANIFPYDEEITVKDVERWSNSLMEHEFIFMFRKNGREYYSIAPMGGW